MSITINFGASPKEIHYHGDIVPEIWDMIWTWKDIYEKQDKATYFEKFDKLARIRLDDHKEYCKANNIAQSYNKCSGEKERFVRIVFHTFNRKIPSPKTFPAGSGSGIGWENKVEHWCEEDRDLYVMAMELGFCRGRKKWRYWGAFRTGGMVVCNALDKWYQEECT